MTLRFGTVRTAKPMRSARIKDNDKERPNTCTTRFWLPGSIWVLSKRVCDAWATVEP